MSVMRVLQVLGRLDRGGAETMIMNLYRHIDRELIQFDFVIHTTDECDYSKEVRDLGGKIYSLKPFTTANALGYRRQWRDFFSHHKNEYGIIHGHMRSTASIYLDEAKKAGLTTIAHSHNTSSGKGFSALVKNILQKGITKHSDYLFSCSLNAGIWLYGKDAVEKDNHIILKNGIEPENFFFNIQKRRDKRAQLAGMREMIQCPIDIDKTSVLIHVGRFDEQKNHRFLIMFMRELVKKKPDTVLILCGQGPLEGEIRSLVDLYNLKSNVAFLGVRADVSDLMLASDIMVFPSLFEGIPLTLVEAQCSGLPVIMSDRVDPLVVINPNVIELPLVEGPQSWAGKAAELIEDMEFYKTERQALEKRMKSNLISAGYNAAENAKWLQNFYMDIHSK